MLTLSCAICHLFPQTLGRQEPSRSQGVYLSLRLAKGAPDCRRKIRIAGLAAPWLGPLSFVGETQALRDQADRRDSHSEMTVAYVLDANYLTGELKFDLRIVAENGHWILCRIRMIARLSINPASERT
ncbi:hypothetical protein [Bradyrhizobium pachyrhizi]|uniref:hypothetical protein n=1 Tax=Bradyrhizobium pachyrhizi TaxID=280333 RepID=UPI00128EF255|nr:hypothetical protein [Bradyrhizobium pachyrhizi]